LRIGDGVEEENVHRGRAPHGGSAEHQRNKKVTGHDEDELEPGEQRIACRNGFARLAAAIDANGPRSFSLML